MRLTIYRSLTMRVTMLALAVAATGLFASPASAQWIGPIKGNDTGGIISYNLVGTADIKAIAVNHCASYGKIVKPLGVQPVYGGYISFACVWVPAGAIDRPLSVRY